MNRAEKWFSERKNMKERRRKRGLRNYYEDTERNYFLERKRETETPLWLQIVCLHRKSKKIQREVQEEIVSSQGELFSFHIPSSHLLSTGIRRACEVEERHVRLSQAPGGTLLVRIRLSSILLYRIPRIEVFFWSSFYMLSYVRSTYYACIYV